jgi:hypothetical protein
MDRGYRTLDARLVVRKARLDDPKLVISEVQVRPASAMQRYLGLIKRLGPKTRAI